MRHHGSPLLARPLRALVAAILLGAGLSPVPRPRRRPRRGVGPLPDCRLDDILTVPRDYDDWAITLVDWILTLGRRTTCRRTSCRSARAASAGGGYVRAVAIDDLKAMAEAASKNGTPLVAWSPFRGYKQQVAALQRVRRLERLEVTTRRSPSRRGPATPSTSSA